APSPVRPDPRDGSRPDRGVARSRARDRGEPRPLLDGGVVTTASDADTASTRAPSRLGRLAGWSASNQYVGVLLVLLCLVIVFSIQEPRFLTVANIRVLLTGIAILWMISLGLTVVMLTGGFDLSLGSMLALSGFIFVGFYLHLAVPALGAVILTVAAGAAIGGLVHVCPSERGGRRLTV